MMGGGMMAPGMGMPPWMNPQASPGLDGQPQMPGGMPGMMAACRA